MYSEHGLRDKALTVILTEGAVTAFVADSWLTGAAFLGAAGLLYLWHRRER